MRATPDGPRCMVPNPGNQEPCMLSPRDEGHPGHPHLDRFGNRWWTPEQILQVPPEVLFDAQRHYNQMARSTQPSVSDVIAITAPVIAAWGYRAALLNMAEKVKDLDAEIARTSREKI